MHKKFPLVGRSKLNRQILDEINSWNMIIIRKWIKCKTGVQGVWRYSISYRSEAFIIQQSWQQQFIVGKKRISLPTAHGQFIIRFLSRNSIPFLNPFLDSKSRPSFVGRHVILLYRRSSLVLVMLAYSLVNFQTVY